MSGVDNYKYRLIHTRYLTRARFGDILNSQHIYLWKWGDIPLLCRNGNVPIRREQVRSSDNPDIVGKPEQDILASFLFGEMFFVMNKYLIRLLAFFILLTGASAGYYFWPATNIPRDETTTIDTKRIGDPSASLQDDIIAKQPLAKDDSSVTNQYATNQNSGVIKLTARQNDNIDSSAANISITIIVGSTTYPLSVSSSTSIYDAMSLLQIDSRQPFSFSAKQYFGMGFFVDEINGVQNDPNTNKYWIIFINDKSSSVGASAYILKGGDVINWKYVTPEF